MHVPGTVVHPAGTDVHAPGTAVHPAGTDVHGHRRTVGQGRMASGRVDAYVEGAELDQSVVSPLSKPSANSRPPSSMVKS